MLTLVEVWLFKIKRYRNRSGSGTWIRNANKYWASERLELGDVSTSRLGYKDPNIIRVINANSLNQRYIRLGLMHNM